MRALKKEQYDPNYFVASEENFLIPKNLRYSATSNNLSAKAKTEVNQLMKSQSATDPRPLIPNLERKQYMEFWGCPNFSLNTFRNNFTQNLTQYKNERNMNIFVFCFLAVISGSACNNYVIRC
eukprot:gene12675-6571_t